MFLNPSLRKTTIRSVTTWAERGSVIAKDIKGPASLGVILAMMNLKKIRTAEGQNDIALAAGLPDALVPRAVKDELAKMSMMSSSPYLKYDMASEYNTEKLACKIVDFHKKNFKTSFAESQVGFSAGSTPVISAVAGITQCIGSTAVVIRPGYPLYDLPVEMLGGSVNKDARLVTALDAQSNGDAFETGGRWNIDYLSLTNALIKTNPSLIYLNFPGNPTGYSPTANESKKLVRVFLDYIRFCWDKGIRAPLILEDMAYAAMMHDNQPFYGLHYTIAHLLGDASPREQELLHELNQSLVIAHSFSKVFSVAGDRVGYFATFNNSLREEISDRMTVVDLTPGRGALAAMTGALKAGEINLESMREYQIRLRHFENGVNDIVTSWGKNRNIRAETLKKLLPMQARADAGFFSLTFFNMLKGHKVSRQLLDSIEDQISKLPETSRVEFLNIFRDGRINHSLDAALWLMETANIITIPMSNQNGNIMVRFSVGQTPVLLISEVLKRIHDAIAEVNPSEEMLSDIHPNRPELIIKPTLKVRTESTEKQQNSTIEIPTSFRK